MRRSLKAVFDDRGATLRTSAGSRQPGSAAICRAHRADLLYIECALDKKQSRMELTNEVALGGDVYCFESVERVTEARAWIDANGCDTIRFRSVFPDARPVSTYPYGSGSQRGT